ncbi:MAG: class I SAM-dependent methyltransferase [Actinomycetia bacterium]|nr:class I SAM-dependent methyltransferase [Actinomycetes bacterium]MCP4223487.1 class I SAM-dependent methyltransferase [Actinomycetes bacterium]MCP5032845.1 class I SAM-dependent methyltransferase [Actinomycetes bacterium]
MTEQGRGDGWDQHAEWWQREFTDGVDPEYTEQILPIISRQLEGRAKIVDIGTGEGQVARQLRGDGAMLVGVDPISSQVGLAAKRGGGAHYVRAEAVALPLADASFEGAVACLVFEHIDDIDGALAEVNRVLVPGGRFVFLLNHPLLQTPGSGWIDDQIIEPPEQYWRVGPYLPEAETIEEVHKDVFIRFLHRPLSRYVNAAVGAGLMLSSMDEPPPPPGFLDQDSHYRDAATIPRLLVLTFTSDPSASMSSS